MSQYSCDVSDALLKLGYPHGGFLSNLFDITTADVLVIETDLRRTLWSPDRQAGPTKVVGPAYTVKYVKKEVKYVPSQGLIASPLEFSQRQYVSPRN